MLAYCTSPHLFWYRLKLTTGNPLCTDTSFRASAITATGSSTRTDLPEASSSQFARRLLSCRSIGDTASRRSEPRYSSPLTSNSRDITANASFSVCDYSDCPTSTSPLACLLSLLPISFFLQYNPPAAPSLIFQQHRAKEEGARCWLAASGSCSCLMCGHIWIWLMVAFLPRTGGRGGPSVESSIV